MTKNRAGICDSETSGFPAVLFAISIHRHRCCFKKMCHLFKWNYHLKCSLKSDIIMGCRGGSVSWASDFGSGHDLKVHESLSPVSGSIPAQSLLHILCPPLSLPLHPTLSKINKHWGTWVAQSVKRPTSAQVMISWSVSSSPV